MLAPLASGGMGTVYAARATGLGGFERLVAIKMLHPHMAEEEHFVRMLFDEARLAARIRHPNVVSVLDVSDEEDDACFLVMDYVEGVHVGTLVHLARKSKQRLPPAIAVRIVLDALAGLAAAHELTDDAGEPLHIVHRDVSPHNVLVGVNGVSRLTDFGIAKAEKRLSQTSHGTFKGKVGYASPEQFDDEEVDQRADIFSMGVVLWEALTAERLFKTDAENKTASSDGTPRPSSISETLAPFDALTRRAMSRDPGDRFQTAEEFLESLEHIARGSSGIATTREVAEFVRLHAADALEKHALKIERGIDSVEREAQLEPTLTATPKSSVRPGPHGAVAPVPGNHPEDAGDGFGSDRPTEPGHIRGLRRTQRGRSLQLLLIAIGSALLIGVAWLLLRPVSGTETSLRPTHEAGRDSPEETAGDVELAEQDTPTVGAADAGGLTVPPPASTPPTAAPEQDDQPERRPPRAGRSAGQGMGTTMRSGRTGAINVPPNPYR